MQHGVTVQAAGYEASEKRARLARDHDVHSGGIERHVLQSPDVSTLDADSALRKRASAVTCSCALVRRPPAFSSRCRPLLLNCGDVSCYSACGPVYSEL